MTLEEIKEAVEVIKAYRQMLTDSVSNQIDGDIEAFDIAIEAMERESCDTISRQAVLDIVEREQNKGDALSEIEKLPSVNPQPKTGHWIFDEILDKHYYCSECKSMGVDYWDFCPNCGARMIEPQESEVQE